MENKFKDIIQLLDLIDSYSNKLGVNAICIQLKDIIDNGTKEEDAYILINTFKDKKIIKDYIIAPQKDKQIIFCMKYINKQEIGIFKRHLEIKGLEF